MGLKTKPLYKRNPLAFRYGYYEERAIIHINREIVELSDETWRSGHLANRCTEYN